MILIPTLTLQNKNIKLEMACVLLVFYPYFLQNLDLSFLWYCYPLFEIEEKDWKKLLLGVFSNQRIVPLLII